MNDAIVIYLQDHLAGARFAVSLLHDLASQDVDPETAELAQRLLQEIEADRAVLERFVVTLGGDSSAMKEAVAWFAQKASRWKLTPRSIDGIFEAVELLCIGVLGKLALWNALRSLDTLKPEINELRLDELCDRAWWQHSALESLRLQLAVRAFER